MLAIVLLNKIFSKEQILSILLFVLGDLWKLASNYVLGIQIFSMMDVSKVVLINAELKQQGQNVTDRNVELTNENSYKRKN